MGSVERWMGNFQPSRGAQPGNGSKRPLKTKIHIFKGKIKSQNNPILLSTANLPKVYSVVNSDTNGSFQVQLPTGEYTLFLELEDGRLYRNSFDGEGNFSTVNITNGENTWDNLIDSREALF
jgi:hypothetical protein